MYKWHEGHEFKETISEEYINKFIEKENKKNKLKILQKIKIKKHCCN